MFKTYRLSRRKVLAIHTVGKIDGRFFAPNFTPTSITFKARNQKEAIKKANKFWIEGDFGMGCIEVREEI